MKKLISVLALFSFNAFSADCSNEYARALNMINTVPKNAVNAFDAIIKKGESECGDLLIGRAILQTYNTYRIKLMEPWIALSYLELFLAKPYAKTHPSYQFAQERYEPLAHFKDQIDELEKQIAAETNMEKKVALLIEEGYIYYGHIDAPYFAFETFQKAYHQSNKTSDHAYSMMGYSLLKYEDSEGALNYFENFLKLFPASVHRFGVFSWTVEIFYLSTFENTGAAKKHMARKALSYLEACVKEFPNHEEPYKSRFIEIRKQMLKIVN